MKTVQESAARAFYEDFTKEVVQCAREANENKSEDDNYDGFSTENIKDGWIDYRGFSFGFALLEDPYRITLTAGPDGPFVGYQQVFSVEDENGKVKLVQEGDGSVTFDCPKELAKAVLNGLTKKLHEKEAI